MCTEAESRNTHTCFSLGDSDTTDIFPGSDGEKEKRDGAGIFGGGDGRDLWREDEELPTKLLSLSLFALKNLSFSFSVKSREESSRESAAHEVGAPENTAAIHSKLWWNAGEKFALENSVGNTQ